MGNAPAARASSNFSCNLGSIPAYYPVCGPDPACTTSTAIQTSHASSWPFKLWIGPPAAQTQWYRGQYAQFGWIYSNYPYSANVAYRVARSGTATTLWQSTSFGICT